MRTLNKWDYESHKYIPVEIPESWYVTTYCFNLDTSVTCPHCGNFVTAGDCYTSNEFHDGIGLGYFVCPDCYDKEWERRLRYDKKCMGDTE